MRINRFLVFILLATLHFAVAAEDALEPSAVDTSNWLCKYCEFEEGWSGEIEIGIGNVTHDSYKFGEYTGLNEDGAFFIGEASMYYRNPDASYLDLSISNLGLDSRSLSVEAGKQGSYKLFLDYHEIPHFISNTGSSPYTGIGTDTLSLPPGWVSSNTTAGMTELATSLKPVELETQRKRLGVGLAFTPGSESNWKYAVKYSEDTKEGNKRIAGSFFTNATQLVEPVDYVTEEVDASVSYNLKKWQANLTYYGSTFRNNNDSLTWQNPYALTVAGADSGELALPPDNQFHQILVSAGYELGENSHISGDIAIGRMEQNEPLLAATQNASLAVSALPATSANAEVDTLDAKLRYMSMPTDDLRLSATYTYNDRDNKTPQLSYDWVTTDMFISSTPSTNLPYSFTRNEARLSADYQLMKGIKLGAGYDLDINERTYQEVDKTTENALWGKLRIRTIEKMYFEVKLARALRDASAYQAVPEIDPPQNPLLTKYNMGDRVRDTAKVHVNITPKQEYTIGLNFDLSMDDYTNSVLGLTESRDFSLSGDITAMLSERSSAYFLLGHQQIESTQTGSQTFSSVADWIANNHDTVNNVGVGMTSVIIEDKLDVGADLTKTYSKGDVSVSAGAPPAFPALRTQVESVKLYANYRLQKSTQLRIAYWFESYDAEDWATDDISADTITNVLGLAEQTPSYNNNVIKLSLLYTF